MGAGIVVCGLNGAGKSTLGKLLAEKLNFYFIDQEDLYFLKTDSIYTSFRTHNEAKKLFLSEIKEHENFVFASVKGMDEKTIYPCIRYVVLINAPQDIRLQRVKNRSFQKFGNRMLPGGDLHKQEESFFDLVKARKENIVETWIQSFSCPIIRIDGTKPVEENVNLIINHITFRISNS